jgi:hypothetical protein
MRYDEPSLPVDMLLEVLHLVLSQVWAAEVFLYPPVVREQLVFLVTLFI